MEEFVGELWHRWITRRASRTYPDAAVTLASVEHLAGVLFRAWGGDAGLRVVASSESRHTARRNWLEKIAGTGDRSCDAALDQETLRLPPEIAVFPQRSLNRDAYLWLIALAGEQSLQDKVDSPVDSSKKPDFPVRHGHLLRWLWFNQQAQRRVLKEFPGLAARFERLVAALRDVRPAAKTSDEQAFESLLWQVLENREIDWTAAAKLKLAAAYQPWPVVLWLYPAPEALPADDAAQEAAADRAERDEQAEPDTTDQSQANTRYQAERVAMPDNESPMILPFRAESLLSWAEYVRVNRDVDDEPDDNGAQAANDMQHLSVTRQGKTVAPKVRFDLDLPAAAQDDLPLGPGIWLPEWDWKKQALVKDRVSLQPMLARDAQAQSLPDHLRRTARKLRGQFSALVPTRQWRRGQPDGSELDLDACVRLSADHAAGLRGQTPGLYRDAVRQVRDLACLVLADVSLSTDAWVSNEHRVIDVVRDTLMLFSEALSATGDSFGLYGFSSLKRGHVRFHSVKEFGDPYDAEARGRIAALKPGYYTRMGAAVRMATRVLQEQPHALRVLLILTDGKPNDIDHYEGRFAIEDTRKSILEAREAGLQPFCVTIDREGAGYLPHVFGPGGYTVVRCPEELPQQLPQLYARLTQV